MLGEFRAEFEETLGKREQLASVFRGVWAGEKRREIAQRLGKGVKRIKGLQREVNRRLAKFAAKARGGVAEMLGAFGKAWGETGTGGDQVFRFSGFQVFKLQLRRVAKS